MVLVLLWLLSIVENWIKMGVLCDVLVRIGVKVIFLVFLKSLNLLKVLLLWVWMMCFGIFLWLNLWICLGVSCELVRSEL